ncbi:MULTISPECIES: ABC transporter ATP-binding protein [Brevibacillus]|uniref:SN-glycerol-3-phosphate transport ATP-binding protein n=1 Tax=Brevibacillus borstelensis AK1 TaxID=1300222 RepID=M8DG68_9BACL|nr:ABC transporter ATP-binding protein [Brevibacillus borstelensis]EMT52442.1 SN-glycerol-3-phosphate transport ATP-binding protein [Brevibacillus borstelensis AK1]KKX55249.1 ABC transporter ATP-binding protein [Brevibacillus borstelensis cifa_chp40]MBE5396224.1 ABC transporter ATP-binding protein [Brevibacillus borstelensis]MCC0563130.1 ABC transporter ATP-binding protein [Brevibacillus borstelensis]MCM3469073.1 ABC transporter ATP-binding protein [Brevibacillus borstelensis]
MAKVVLKQVTKEFNGQQVVKGLDLVIPDGSFTVLVGPSGCGKSTTLRMIAGLEQATGGEILIGEQPVNDLPPGKRDVAMVFQNYALYPTMSVYDNISYGLRNRGYSKKECQVLVEEIAEVVGLAPYLKRKPSQLSGGQRQRVALARAMVKKPQVFLMDEPLSNLDAKLRNQMRVELTSLHKQLGSTFIYVTHDQVEAMTMGDQIVVMNEGQIMQVAAPMDLYQEPDNLFVAQFIGSPAMNIVPAAEREDQVWGFRPEKALLRHAGVSSVGHADAMDMHGHIVSREILGSDTLYHVETDKGRVVVKTDTESLLDAGSAVHVTVPLSSIYVFDRATGKRIARAENGVRQQILAGGVV